VNGYLLDTQAILWWRAGRPALGRRARAVLLAPDAPLWLSVCSIWEICIKRALGKLELGLPTVEFVTSTLGAGIKLLDIRPPQLYRLESMPFHHRDPFDRMLVAQALVEDLSLVARDKTLARYGVDVVWG
jgi:PIN domain nuclease of toxin-antitoxin system